MPIGLHSKSLLLPTTDRYPSRRRSTAAPGPVSSSATPLRPASAMSTASPVPHASGPLPRDQSRSQADPAAAGSRRAPGPQLRAQERDQAGRVEFQEVGHLGSLSCGHLHQVHGHSHHGRPGPVTAITRLSVRRVHYWLSSAENPRAISSSCTSRATAVGSTSMCRCEPDMVAVGQPRTAARARSSA